MYQPVLRIHDINPMLFRYLEELEEVKVLPTAVSVLDSKRYQLADTDEPRNGCWNVGVPA